MPLKISLSSSTSAAVIRVYFMVLAIVSSMSEYDCTALRPAIISPVTAAATAIMAVCAELSHPLKRCQRVFCVARVAFTFWSSALSNRILATCASQAAVPRCNPLSCCCSWRSAVLSCFGVALLSRRSTCSAVEAVPFNCSIALRVEFSSRCNFFIVALSPATAAFAIPFSRRFASFSSWDSIF